MTTPYEEGDPNSKLLVLGQAPSGTEMRYKKPLVGPAGQVFNDCMHYAGLSRRQCYILNVWEDPVYEKSKSIYSRDGGPPLWTPKGLTEHGLNMAQGCIDRILKSKANCILALGQQALDLCTEKSAGIMKWRGSILQGTRVPKKVVPTVHPASVIYGSYMLRYSIFNDMIRAGEESLTDKLILPKRNISVVKNIEEARAWFACCMEQSAIASDIEVVNHQLSCFSIAISPSECKVIPLTCDTGDYWTEEDEIEILLMYADLLSNPNILKINQNIAGFDAVFLMLQNNIRTVGPLGDTQIAQRLLYPELNRGLAYIASVHTREPYWKDDGKMWKNEGGDFDQWWLYNGKDSCVAFEAWGVLADEMTKRDMWPTYEMTISAYEPLLFMSLDGILVNQEKLDVTKTNIAEQILEKEAELEATADYMFNPNSSMQCCKYFYDHKGIDEYKNANGGRTCDDKALVRIYRKTGLPEVKLVQTLRNLKKLKSTYLDVVADKDGKLRSSWDPAGTWTGRLSSSKMILGTGMNLQNLDPRFKEFLVEDIS